ncbi:hypothetical protein BDV28DRAFT_133131 [Aspergillus coremiiformis]|uniref:Uncharacterized protein n=1 Tax=Aspergillus coremiiformis TaxID=138285 RepID=A0A5N6Z737_9EURO|nr:hypothetical protein BDV28DRAFT_133131 [Aspergillus coremiiformis]
MNSDFCDTNILVEFPELFGTRRDSPLGDIFRVWKSAPTKTIPTGVPLTFQVQAVFGRFMIIIGAFPLWNAN